MCYKLLYLMQDRYKFSRDLWSKTTNVLSTSQIPLVTLQSKSQVINKKLNIIPKKNINKLNVRGESILHVACLKVYFLHIYILYVIKTRKRSINFNKI